MSGIVSRLSVLGKVWLGLAAGAMALIIFCLAAPGSSLFFPLVSLWCNAALFALALLVLRRAGVELDLFHKAVLVGLWAAAVLYFYWTLGSRTFLYHWDYVNYILKQYHAEAAFAQSTGAGFRFLLDSITEDYTNFITLFTEFPFCLSGKTGDDYAFCQVFSVLPSLLVLLAGLTVKVGRMLRVKNRFWYFLIGFSWCATFPFVRMSAVLGQPDWFGLIFAFMLMLLLGGFAAPVTQSRFQGFLSHNGAMHLFTGQSTKVCRNILIGHLGRFFHRLALDHFSQRRARRNSAGTAERLEGGIFDDAFVVDLQEKL